jgi:hypothetical protein
VVPTPADETRSALVRVRACSTQRSQGRCTCPSNAALAFALRQVRHLSELQCLQLISGVQLGVYRAGDGRHGRHCRARCSDMTAKARRLPAERALEAVRVEPSDGIDRAAGRSRNDKANIAALLTVGDANPSPPVHTEHGGA